MPATSHEPTSREQSSSFENATAPKRDDTASKDEDAATTIHTTDRVDSLVEDKENAPKVTATSDDGLSSEAAPSVPYTWQNPFADVPEHPEGDAIRRQASLPTYQAICAHHMCR